MSKLAGRTDWAEEEDEDSLSLPQPSVVKNKDGTETHISYQIRDDGKKVKITRKIKKTVHKTIVNHAIAERKQWTKFGQAQGKPPGPENDTTTVGENIVFRPTANWKAAAQEEKGEEAKKRNNLKDAKIKCRICSGDHWTTKCPFKDTMAPEGEVTAAAPLDLNEDEMKSTQGGSYVPPHMRGAGRGSTGEKMAGGKYERDDLATLRVTNVSEIAEEQDLRDMFSRYGHVTRVFLAKDRETGRAKGFAFVSFADRDDAAKACARLDGHGYGHLIMKVEFAKKAT